jgi:ketosteroid isomerase-like protein
VSPASEEPDPTDPATDPATQAEVLAAAAALVDAFATGDLEGYFAAFADDATFLFHTHPEPILSTAGYREVWDRWVGEDGFSVLGATSSEQVVRSIGPTVAVFVHRVVTTVRTGAGEAILHERETIVFERRQGRWLAVHEHLSSDPGAGVGGDGPDRVGEPSETA